MKNNDSKILISSDTSKLLDGYLSCFGSTSPSGINRNFVVTALIKALCLMDKDIRMELCYYFYRREQEIKEKVKETDGVEQAKLIAKADEFERLIDLCNFFSVIRPELSKDDLSD